MAGYTGFRMSLGGDDVTLQAGFTHIGATVVTGYTWASSDSGVATATAVGNGSTATLHAVAAGTCTLTLTGNVYTGSPLTSTMTVKVGGAEAPGIHILTVPTSSGGFPNDPGGMIPGHGDNPE